MDTTTDHFTPLTCTCGVINLKPITVLEDLNNKACLHIKSYLSQHNKEEFEIDTFNLDKEIEKIDPDLWQAIIALTKSKWE